ncbi:hypothetical protein ACP70R_005525 [Stipagrostis hirtigluma subsp. patula]
MKSALSIAVVCFLLVLNAAAHVVESRRLDEDSDEDSDQGQRMWFFVFGDSYADTGNFPNTGLSSKTRGWYPPYGSSDDAHDKQPTGRLSNGFVQPDFIAKILGLDESPLAEGQRSGDNIDHFSFGVNFAVGGAAVHEGALFKVSLPEVTLSLQISRFSNLLAEGVIDNDLLDRSVALIAFSDGRDYGINSTIIDDAEVVSLTRDVTDWIVDGVTRLRKLGVKKVMVNTLPPLGCKPGWTRQNNYTACVSPENVVPLYHNMYLRQKLSNLSESGDVLLLDLHKIFTEIIHTPGRLGSQKWKRFYHKYTPCCESTDPMGFCGQKDDYGEDQFTVCESPHMYFFWDDMHLTEAGYQAVVEELQDSIKSFLDISS